MLNLYSLRKLLKIRVCTLTENNDTIKLEYEEIKNKILIKLYRKSEESDKYFFLRGHALIISKDGKWFKAGEEFKFIEEQNIKSRLISLACEYCNIQAERGADNVITRKYRNSFSRASACSI